MNRGGSVMNFNVYEDIANRTNGDIYLGVVGPVRTGKSTFIKKFMDKLVIPNIQEEFQALRAKDELPQSGSGKTIMTTEPKFVPNEAVNIQFDESTNVNMKVRLIDCVGYLIDDAIGSVEDGTPRMIMTPWSETPMTFEKAAETGTQKVIKDHSTIGMLVTTDGSILDIPREKYVEAEERVVKELQAINKPFVIVLNTKFPDSEDVAALKDRLAEKYNTSVIPVDIANIEINDINTILKEVLYEFPIKEIKFNVPIWFKAIDEENAIKKSMMDIIENKVKGSVKIRDILSNPTAGTESIGIRTGILDLGKGEVSFDIYVEEKIFYNTLNENAGQELNNKLDLLNYIRKLSEMSVEYSRIRSALDSAKSRGYGIVLPDAEELQLENPEVTGKGNRYSLKLKASAPSIHVINAQVDTEVTPFVGSQAECERIMNEMKELFEEDPAKMWEMEIFGKNLNELVMNNLNGKVGRMSEDHQEKIKRTLSRVLNENGRGIVFIII